MRLGRGSSGGSANPEIRALLAFALPGTMTLGAAGPAATAAPAG
jgi:hypothetical protein